MQIQEALQPYDYEWSLKLEELNSKVHSRSSLQTIDSIYMKILEILLPSLVSCELDRLLHILIYTRPSNIESVSLFSYN